MKRRRLWVAVLVMAALVVVLGVLIHRYYDVVTVARWGRSGSAHF